MQKIAFSSVFWQRPFMILRLYIFLYLEKSEHFRHNFHKSTLMSAFFHDQNIYLNCGLNLSPHHVCQGRLFHVGSLRQIDSTSCKSILQIPLVCGRFNGMCRLILFRMTLFLKCEGQVKNNQLLHNQCGFPPTSICEPYV